MLDRTQILHVQAPADIKKGEWFAINLETGAVLLEKLPEGAELDGEQLELEVEVEPRT
jgi:hypothetical protein